MLVYGGAFKNTKQETKVLSDLWSIDLWANNSMKKKTKRKSERIRRKERRERRRQFKSMKLM